MSLKVTLGGDRRLGSGKKMKVELETYGRSNHDLSRVRRTTLASGTLVPVLNLLGVMGDKFEIDLDVDIKTHPTVGPLFGSYKVQLDVFKCDIRLYQGRLHNNETGLGTKMDSVHLPTMTLQAFDMNASNMEPYKVNTAQLNPSSLLAHLGMAGIGQKNALADGKRDFNATSVIAYFDAVKNYYANHPEKIGMIIHNDIIEIKDNVANIRDKDADIIPQIPTTYVQGYQNGDLIYIEWTVDGPQDLNQIIFRMGYNIDDTEEVSAAEIGVVTNETATETTIQFKLDPTIGYWIRGWRYANNTDILPTKIQTRAFELGDLDHLRKAILSHAFTNPGAPFNLNTEVGTLTPWRDIFEVADGRSALMSSQEGLALKTYQSDMFRNWLNTEDVTSINLSTSVSTAGGSFTMDALNLAEKMFNIENRILAAGGDYNAWQEAVWGIEKYSRSEIPVYVGGLSKELVFEEIISNSEGNAGGKKQPLGTLAGKGRMAGKHKGGKVSINVDEPCVILGILSLTPRVDYSQGNDWTFNLETLDDLHKPELDQIGFQDMIREKFAYWTTSQHPDGHWIQESHGKQSAWLDYQTAVNETKGNFATGADEDFMALNARYTPGVSGTYFNLLDGTAYVDPEKFNHTFAVTSLDSQNFWANVAIDIDARRVMSAKIMPNM